MRRALLTLAFVLAGLAVSSPEAAAATACAINKPVVGKPSSVRRGTLTADVVVYGDSLTYQIGRMLPTSYGVDGYWGRKTKPTVDRLRYDLSKRARAPKVVVMAIGTNDRQDPSGVGYQVRATRALLPKTTRLIWVNVYAEYDKAGAQDVNRRLLQPGVEIIDWFHTNEVWASRNGGRSPLVDAEGVHVTCDGARARVYTITHKVSR